MYRSTTAGSSHVQIADVATAGFIDTAVTNGTTYYYYVTAYDAVEEIECLGRGCCNATRWAAATAGTIQFECELRRCQRHIELGCGWSSDGLSHVSEYDGRK